MSRASESTRLCERCGYDLSAGSGDRCPECGLAVSASDPARRVGSAVQRRPGDPRAWAADVAGMAFRPRRFWARVRVEPRRSGWLWLTNHGLASIALVGPIASNPRAGASGFGVVSWLLVAWVGFAALTAIEYAGLRVFGRRRGWRVTHTVSLTVTAHASAAWVIGGALASAGLSIGQLLPAEPIHPWLWTTGSPFAHVLVTWEYVPVVGGALAGFALFEVWTYAGWRAMRFANRA